MFQLSEQQIDTIYERLHQEGLKNLRLEQDLFDHFCCYVESAMEQGENFEESYQKAVGAISPQGLKEIEFELYFILNYNKQVSMKKLIFSTGFASAFLLSTGVMFKTLHWFPGQILLFLGFATMLLTMLFLSIHSARFFRNRPASFWLRTITGIASLALIAIGAIFKTLHFPGANVLYGLGTIVLNFVFLPLFFYHIYKHGLVKTSTENAA